MSEFDYASCIQLILVSLAERKQRMAWPRSLVVCTHVSPPVVRLTSHLARRALCGHSLASGDQLGAEDSRRCEKGGHVVC
eukprot:6607443-Pyramimonas_sp.AAC.1